jgi:hypothetical protein
MISKRTVLMTLGGAVLGLTAVGAVLGALGTPTLEQPLQPVARPDLALAVTDLPPGYAPAMPDYAATSPLALRVLRRTSPGAGPAMIWSAAFDAGTPEQADLAVDHPAGIAALLSPSMAPQLSDWEEIEAVEGEGRHAHVYRFRYSGSDAQGASTGILLLSQHDKLVTCLALFGPEEQTRAELPAYTQTAEAHMAAAQPRGRS